MQDMTSNNKFLTVLLSAALLSVGLVSRAAGPHSIYPDSGQREALGRIYDASYDHNPSMLSWWDYSTWSTIGAEAYAESGKLHAPLSPDGRLGGKVGTSSILHQKGSGWSFSGKFEYGIESTDSLRSTLSYRRKPYGSPSMFFCIAPARTWEIQNYTLGATASKRLGERWSLGAQIEYIGWKQFRKSDVRNEQSALDIRIEAGATVAAGRSLLSAGFIYERYKEKPQFSRVYNSGADYFIYLMTGLGTQVTGLENSPSWTQNVPGAYLEWALRGDTNRLSVRYSFKYGQDHLKSESTQSSSYQETRTEYAFMAHGLELADVRSLGNGGKLLFDTDFYLTQGDGSDWNKTISSFVEDYQALLYGGSLSAGYYNSSSWFRKAGISAAADGENRHDKNYDATLDGIRLVCGASVGFGCRAGKADISLDLNGGMSFWPYADYEPNAARDGYNIYTTYVGRAEEAYMNAGQWLAGLKFDVEFPVGKNLVDLGAAWSYSRAVAENVYRDASRQTGRVFMNFCF